MCLQNSIKAVSDSLPNCGFDGFTKRVDFLKGGVDIRCHTNTGKLPGNISWPYMDAVINHQVIGESVRIDPFNAETA